MLQKLNTSKYTIKSSDITKDRDTRQVNLSLEGKKRSETGGLTTNLNVAENAFVKLTSNIDATDGLANGVRGIIQKLITNGEGSVSVILVKFDDERVGEKAKVLSQYKEQYPKCCSIFRHGISFQHKNITIFRSQFPLVLAWASTIHSVQGLTVNKIVVDLSKIFAAGKAYVALSWVRSLQGLQILNYKSSAIRKDKRVQKEMIRLLSKAITFNWPVIPTLQHEQWIKICHLNVRGHLNHISDIKTDPNICSADIMCFTETHLRNSNVYTHKYSANKTSCVIQERQTYRCSQRRCNVVCPPTDQSFTSKYQYSMIRIYWSDYFTCSKQAISYNSSLQKICLYIHPALHINASTITMSSYFTTQKHFSTRRF